jgi:hypothetical protein
MISKLGCFGLSFILLFCAQEGLHELINLLLGFLQVIVYDYVVELRSEGQLIASLGKALFDYLWGICVAAYQAAAQFLYRRRLHEDAQGTFAIELLDIDATLYIYVENHRLALGKLVFYLRLQGAVESILVNFLILQELISLNLGLEFLWRQEEILYSILLCAARGTRGTTDRESQLQLWVLFHQPVDDGTLAAARWGAENQ